MLVPVILCGGVGTRLWPLSRHSYPKQFLALTDRLTLLQRTVLRARRVSGDAPLVMVCNDEYRFVAAEQVEELDVGDKVFILEPVGRNTAPAVAVAALYALARWEDPVLLVLPSDHVVAHDDLFARAVSLGEQCARNGWMVTFGVLPHRPETGFGYIRAGAVLEGEWRAPDDIQVHRIERFVEKPALETAVRYLEEGGYLWNSGMFLFRASRFMEELEAAAPEMVRLCREAVRDGAMDLGFHRLASVPYETMEAGSVDELVMEGCRQGAVISVDLGWNDLGSWAAIREALPKDGQGNAAVGDAVIRDCRDTVVWSGGRLVAALGLEGAAVVETDDAVLVASLDRVQEVKGLVSALGAEGREEVRLPRKVYRPWGSYRPLATGERFQVKHIVVKPGASLSLQMHHHRAEHWIVVRGTARITKDGKTFLLTENQSAYIPVGVTHRLENPGIIPLELIEVQSGSYLGEDDIVRLEDRYGRANDDG